MANPSVLRPHWTHLGSPGTKASRFPCHQQLAHILEILLWEPENTERGGGGGGSMEVIPWSRGRNASELTQRSWGGGWEGSPTNLDNIAKLQSRTQPGRALLGLPSPRDSPCTKLCHGRTREMPQSRDPCPKPKCCELLAEFQECCYWEISHWGDPQPCRAHPVQWQGWSSFPASQGSPAQQLCIPGQGQASQGLWGAARRQSNPTACCPEPGNGSQGRAEPTAALNQPHPTSQPCCPPFFLHGNLTLFNNSIKIARRSVQAGGCSFCHKQDLCALRLCHFTLAAAWQDVLLQTQKIKETILALW